MRAELEARWKELDADFHFVATCNEGGESWHPKRSSGSSRLRGVRGCARSTIASGCPGGAIRRTEIPAPSLPAVEQLLADKPQHVTERSAADLLPAENAWRFRLQPPRHKRNNGEIYNFCIGRGTLTEEERYVINEHVVQTIRMLSQLPFPKHLKNGAGDRRRASREIGRDWLPQAAFRRGVESQPRGYWRLRISSKR